MPGIAPIDLGQHLLQGEFGPLVRHPMVFERAGGVQGGTEDVADCFGRASASCKAAMQAASWPCGTKIDVRGSHSP